MRYACLNIFNKAFSLKIFNFFNMFSIDINTKKYNPHEINVQLAPCHTPVKPYYERIEYSPL